jgi:hypothetical protein
MVDAAVTAALQAAFAVATIAGLSVTIVADFNVDL